MITLFAESSTPRLRYTLDYIFGHIIHSAYHLTTSLEEARNANGPVINYSHQIIRDSFQILPANILFEADVNKMETSYELEDNKHRIYFTESKEKTFDALGAVFFFISRYEEYFHPKTDHHGRLLTETSWIGRHHLLKVPLVDIWTNELADQLNERFNLGLQKPGFTSLSTIDLDNGFKYHSKGLKRTCGGILNDLKSLKFKNMARRILTVLRFRKDDFDIYDWLINYHEVKKLPLHIFVLNARRSNHDRGLPKNGQGIRYLVNKFKEHDVPFGVHPSYSSNRNPLKVDHELDGLRRISNLRINSSRQHYLKFQMPQTFMHLIHQGIEHDYSMGFAPQTGFRAATSRSFFFYDLEQNEATPLQMHPITVMEGTYKDYLRMRPSLALNEITEMIQIVKKHGGTFISIWHEAQLAEKSPWRRIYLEMNEAVQAE